MSRKVVKKYANVEVMPQIDEIPVRITDRVSNFLGILISMMI